jgi:hypothetical protein
VGVADDGDDGDGGADHLGEAGHLAEVGDAHLDDGGFVLFADKAYCSAPWASQLSLREIFLFTPIKKAKGKQNCPILTKSIRGKLVPCVNQLNPCLIG